MMFRGQKTRRGIGTGAILSVVLLLGLPADARALGPDEASELAGWVQAFAASFRFTGGDREDAARLEAIDECVDEMLFVARPFARSRLRSATVISKEIAFDVSEAVLAIRDAGERPLLVPLEGKPVQHVSKAGDELETTLKRDGRKLVLRTLNERGGEERVLTLSPDGKKLTIEVTIFADPLPLPIRYQLSYRRLTPPAR
ncbi:MAG: hypothetical protein P1V51_02945 [Deltaproteobacteria bacterium]|nr:hypothetical protein [Deltaproteobacteria bacterium]